MTTTTAIQEGTTGIPPGDLNEDLSGETMFMLNVFDVDIGQGAGFDVSMTVFDGLGAAHKSTINGVSVDQTLTWQFTDYTNAGVDMSDVKAIRFEVQGDPEAGDLSRDTLKAFNAIPEPGTLVLLGLGVLGIFGYGWRRRKATK